MTNTDVVEDTGSLRRAMNLLEGKYSLHILRELSGGAKRFSELQRQIAGISPKTLTDQLRRYSSSGIVSRQSFAEIPPRVEYRLTDKGRALRGIIDDLESLGRVFDAETESA
ncbi:winged helix-turn-helix transcriptional regulator [Lysobacter fragariae]